MDVTMETVPAKAQHIYQKEDIKGKNVLERSEGKTGEERDRMGNKGEREEKNQLYHKDKHRDIMKIHNILQ